MANPDAALKSLGREPTEEMLEAADPKEWIGHPAAPEDSKARWFASYRRANLRTWQEMWDAATPAEREGDADGIDLSEFDWLRDVVPVAPDEIDRVRRYHADYASREKITQAVYDDVDAIALTAHLYWKLKAGEQQAGQDPTTAPSQEGHAAGPAASPAPTTAAGEQGTPETRWTCFFCDETFTDRDAAEAHFGLDEWENPPPPGCVQRLTDGEAEMRRQWVDMHKEVTRAQDAADEAETRAESAERELTALTAKLARVESVYNDWQEMRLDDYEYSAAMQRLFDTALNRKED